MRTFVESLKRLYLNNKITTEKIAEFLDKGIITAEEYVYITT